MDSHVSRAINRATAEATKRGHKLGAWGFSRGQAANRCERDGCDCRVLVTPGDALEVVGAAVALGCKEGGNAALEAPEPTPSGPTHAELPAEAPRAVNVKRVPTDAELRALSMKSFGRAKATTR